MKLMSAGSASSFAKFALVAAAFAAGTGVAFAAWMDRGAQIFMTMIDTGLSWCF